MLSQSRAKQAAPVDQGAAKHEGLHGDHD
jgi:hypothetical protein